MERLSEGEVGDHGVVNNILDNVHNDKDDKIQ